MDYEDLLKKNASQSLSSAMPLCFFGRKKIPCETEATVLPTSYGHCYTFNSAEVIKARGKPLLVRRAGNDYMFRFMAFVGHSEHDYNDRGVSSGAQVSSNSLLSI